MAHKRLQVSAALCLSVAGPVPATEAIRPVCVHNFSAADLLRSDSLQVQVLVTLTDRSLPDTHWQPTREIHWPPSSPEGQVAQVDGILGRSEGILGPDSLVVIYRWRSGGAIEGCTPVPLRILLPADTRQVFTATLRPRERWVEGIPTLDAFPHRLREFPGTGPATDSTVALRWEFLRVLPSLAEWKQDCRPGVRRTEVWIDAEPRRRWEGVLAGVTRDLRPLCDLSLERHAETLQRWEDTVPIPDQLREALGTEGCPLDEPGAHLDALRGEFTRDLGREWAIMCRHRDHWRLQVVRLDPTPVISELARLVGNGSGWSLSVAPPEYFDWTSSRSFRYRLPPPPPERWVVLLTSHTFQDSPTYAFYETADGWVQISVHCCAWPE